MTKKQIIEAIEQQFKVINVDGELDLPQDKQFVTDKTGRDLITGLVQDEDGSLMAVSQVDRGGSDEFFNPLMDLSAADLQEILKIMTP
jgi:hypothetical protein